MFLNFYEVCETVKCGTLTAAHNWLISLKKSVDNVLILKFIRSKLLGFDSFLILINLFGDLIDINPKEK